MPLTPVRSWTSILFSFASTFLWMKILVVMMVLQEQLDRYVWTDICDPHALPCGTAALPLPLRVLCAACVAERATGVPSRKGSERNGAKASLRACSVPITTLFFWNPITTLFHCLGGPACIRRGRGWACTADRSSKTYLNLTLYNLI